MLVYVAAAILVLVVTDGVLRDIAVDPGVRRGVVLAWMIALPLFGWWVWRNGAAADGH
jgi:hypothetical protein